MFYGDRLVQLVLCGSQARGNAEPGSDIEVLVVLWGEVNAGQEIRVQAILLPVYRWRMTLL